MLETYHHIVTYHSSGYYIYRRPNSTEPYSEYCKVSGGYGDALMLMSILNRQSDGIDPSINK